MMVRLLPDSFPSGINHHKVKKMTTEQKFSSVMDILEDAVNRQIVLDIQYPLIYNQVVRFYEDRGVQLYGDVDEDYEILLSKLETDLFYYET